ncbi:uracil-DNA glycosylase [Hydrogenophaga crocea]|uniref:Type-4 uracil-DNA glycosylase n=1 Tax=Hydrogenophaga crocea TaxID=2716225 RepID=A0A6G8IJX0_9BURK|nr:uracil-DNA glycosylase [Hydrogenophaga crocea]QIM53280.1 uracil-DNA glycosylase [Hydrogenophaga crocea]
MTADDRWVRELDARQRAMLAEMGVKLWLPKPRPAAATATAADPEPPAAPVVAEPAPPAVSAARHPAPAPVQAPTAAPAAAPVIAAAAAPATVAARADIATLDWPALREAVAGCRACGLCESRRNTVFGVGHTQADWMIVGEAPGENEDRQGEPFVGAAGQLLDAMLRACGRSRTSDEAARSVYIANVLKCRPPANRNPAPEEVLRCEPYLARQVALVKPRLIIAMGRFAVQSLLKTTEPIGRLRGRVHHYEGVPVIVTYHPAYLLRTPIDKAKAWADLCMAMAQ